MSALRPTASQALSDGYAYTATLAERRQERVANLGDIREAQLWGRVATYCWGMSRSRAVDDDQFQFQRDQARYSREIPMSNDDLDKQHRAPLWSSSGRRPKEWQLAMIELALGYLSPMQRICFELVVGGRLTIGEVAAAIGGEPGEVRTHLARARRRLKSKVPDTYLSLLRPARTNLYAENTYK